VSLLGEIIIDRLRKVLGGAEMTAEENATMITEMVLWDSEDFKAFYGQKIKVVKEIEESGTRRNNKMSGEMKVLK
jgi:hypothetical protein